MESNNAENRDAAIQTLIDQMRIPAENRSAAASKLLQYMRLWEELNQYGPSLDDKRRARRIAKLQDKLRKEQAGLPSVLEWELFLRPRCEVIPRYWKIRRGFDDVRLFGVLTGLYRVQKEEGGKLLTLTKNLKSRQSR
jgi:hypothetical protein